MNLFLWGIFPYIIAAIMIGGTIWRYKFDQYGWTTRSSELYESKLLKIASPLFHYALFAVFAGHLLGLFIPKAATEWLGITDEMYHKYASLMMGGPAGVLLAVGIGMLIWRRRTITPVFKATTRNDKAMYLVLALVIAVGLAATFTGGTTPSGEHVNYRDTVSVWVRSLFTFHPNVEAMAAATWQFKLHVFIALLLFGMTPFTRLVHAFTVPLHYLFRPYVVYRSRDVRKSPVLGVRRGWDPVGTPDHEKGKRW